MTVSQKSAESSAPDARTAAERAAREEESLRERWEATQESFRERFDQPIQTATKLTKATMAWFPVRVWRHFLIHNGFLLGAGISYQALFAIFAAIYVAFAITGLWLGGNEDAVNAMIALINSYIPGLIGDNGVITTEEVQQIASSTSGVLGVTGTHRPRRAHLDRHRMGDLLTPRRARHLRHPAGPRAATSC